MLVQTVAAAGTHGGSAGGDAWRPHAPTCATPQSCDTCGPHLPLGSWPLSKYLDHSVPFCLHRVDTGYVCVCICVDTGYVCVCICVDTGYVCVCICVDTGYVCVCICVDTGYVCVCICVDTGYVCVCIYVWTLGMYVCAFVWTLGMYVCAFVWTLGMYVCAFCSLAQLFVETSICTLTSKTPPPLTKVFTLLKDYTSKCNSASHTLSLSLLEYVLASHDTKLVPHDLRDCAVKVLSCAVDKYASTVENVSGLACGV